jgi:hypothetical protein
MGLGSEIRKPGKPIPIPDAGIEKAPDPEFTTLQGSIKEKEPTIRGVAVHRQDQQLSYHRQQTSR